LSAEVIFGGVPAAGSACRFLYQTLLRPATGIQTSALDRFSYTLPEAAGIDSKTLREIENIATEAIQNGATPGSYVMVIKDGKVIYDKCQWLA
jgi:beta-N-acetylhexosaminidase